MRNSFTGPFRYILLIAVMISLVALSTTGAAARELRLGAYKYLSDNDMKKILQPFVNYLAATIKIPVKLYITSTYSELSQRFISGEMDMAIIPPYAYVKLADRIKLQLLASMKLDGNYYYNGVVAVNANSGIDSLGALAGKRIAYVSKDSASGYLYPRILFKKNGLDPDRIFSATSFSGSHVESIRSLVNGTADGACIFKASLEFAKLQGVDTAGIKVIAETENIPHEAFIAQHNMNPDLSRAIKQALTSFRYAESDVANFSKLQRSMFKMEGWVVGFDSLYDPVREAQKYFPNPELENADLDTTSVTIGFYPRSDVETVRKIFAPVIDYLSKETGLKFKLAFSPNYLDVGNQLLEGNYQISILTPLALVLAREKSKIALEPVVQRAASNGTTYNGVIVCRNTSEINVITDLKDSTFAFTEPDSISGRLYPLALFKKSNMPIKTFFKKTYYAGNHRKALEDVLNGTADACATNEHDYSLLVAADEKAKKSLKVIYKTPPIPHDYWTVMSTAPEATKTKIKKALLKINGDRELKSKLFGGINYDSFAEPDENGLNELAEMLKIIL